MSAMNNTVAAAALARSIYAAALAGGADTGTAVNAAWMAVRREVAPRSRALCAWQAIHANTQRRKSYRCPMGRAFQIEGMVAAYGHHAGNWPRTKRSYKEAQSMMESLARWLASA